MKCLTVEERVLYARLIVALADRDSLNIVAVYKAMGVRTKLNNPTVLEAWATILNDRDDAEVLEGFNFQVSLFPLAFRCLLRAGCKASHTCAPSSLQGREAASEAVYCLGPLCLRVSVSAPCRHACRWAYEYCRGGGVVGCRMQAPSPQ